MAANPWAAELHRAVNGNVARYQLGQSLGVRTCSAIVDQLAQGLGWDNR